MENEGDPRMIELLVENWEEFFLYSLYVSFVLHFILILSYRWLYTHSFHHQPYAFEKMNLVEWTQYQKNHSLIRFSIIHWLPKAIRRKIQANEDSDGPTILLHLLHS